ncbi:MAG: hypothetical protein ASARMPRED_001288 [Alectoria sarmentosa]|nr:MAG: hypothetical protein ASARMPRED_001288 [Alectoria sarmentosa]
MDPFRGITVQIIVNGQSLPFYHDPDVVEDASQHIRQKYIEAVTGSAFQVKFLLKSDYELCGLKPKDAVRMSMDVDESSTAHLSMTEALELGRIRLTVYRVKREKRLVPKFRSTVPIATVKEVPEKALKGRSIANTVSLAKGIPSEAPEPHRYRGVAIAGQGGRPAIFDVFYRPRRSLQMMGCIARSPSPVGENSAHSSNGQSTAPSFTGAGGSQDVLREVQDLRARLAQLERGLIVEQEPADANTRFKIEQVRAIKHEREEDESERPSQRRRMPAEIEHVDLTDD